MVRSIVPVLIGAIVSVLGVFAVATPIVAVDGDPDRPFVPVRVSVLTDPDGVPATFGFEIAGEPWRAGPTSPLTIETDLGVPLTIALADAGPEHVLSDIICAESATGVTPDPMAIDLDAGTVTFADPTVPMGCAFVLSDVDLARRVTVVVETDEPGPDTGFELIVDDSRGSEPIPMEPGTSRGFPVPPGRTFSMTLLDPPAPFVLDGLACVDDLGHDVLVVDPRSGAEVAPGAAVPSVGVAAPPGGAANCTFRLISAPIPPGSATVRVVTDPPDAAAAFDFEIDGVPVRIRPGAPHHLEAPIDATVAITLTDTLADHTLEVFGCSTASGVEPQPYERDEATSSVTFGLHESRDVFCTFRLQQPPATVLAGAVFEDADGDGHRDDGDAGIKGRTVELWSGGGPSLVASTSTAADGMYRFDVANLDGAHLVCLPDVPDWGQTFPSDGDTCVLLGSAYFGRGHEIGRAVGEASMVDGLDFGVRQMTGASSSIPAPRAGRWRAVNKAGRISCGGFDTRLPKSTDSGRIKVEQGGRRIIATGLAEGRKTRIVLKADPDKPGRWSGTLTVKEQGQSITLDYRMDLVDEKHIKGTMSGDFKVRGQSCTLKRDFLLTHQGK